MQYENSFFGGKFMLKIGVFKTSLRENERRIPIYPEHFLKLPSNIRSQMILETGYGEDYGYTDNYFEEAGAKIDKRDNLFIKSDLLILPKPVIEDFLKMKENQIVFGWFHCVQQRKVVQAAIDKKLTLIAWESMYHWSEKGERDFHILYKNNEIAGYAAVLHILQLLGMDGHYGSRKKVVIFGYGSVSRGAIYALQGRGFNNIHVFTKRPPHLVENQNPDVYYGQFYTDSENRLMVIKPEMNKRLLIEELAEADIICNGILQDPLNPIIFVNDNEISYLKPRSVIIDISCDEKMGFSFARPTSFKDPIFKIGNNIIYYSVDHTPTYLWNASTREISKAIFPYLPIIAEGINAWQRNYTIKSALEILNGEILNKTILKFQNRDTVYPYKLK
jgi:alanine dehydrogenase